MVTTQPTVILGIDPGARQIGICVLKGEELVQYGVKTFRRKRLDEALVKLREIIKNLITEYEVDFVAIEKPVFVQQHRSFVKVAAEEITSYLREEKISYAEYNPKYIREVICGTERATKRNTALLLSQQYNELTRYFNVPRLWQKRYYAQLFGAIAVGLICARKNKEASETKES